MRIEIDHHIGAPPGDVFDAMTDIHGLAERIPAITKCELLTDGPVAVGTRFRETRVMFGKEATEEMEFTKLDRPGGFTLEAKSHGMHYITSYTFTEERGGTRVVLSFNGIPQTFGAKLFQVIGFLFKGTMVKAFRADFDAMRQSIEAKGKAA